MALRSGAFRRAIAEVKQRWSLIVWVTKNILHRAPPCFGRHVKPLVPSAIAVVSTHQVQCPSIGDIYRLMMILITYLLLFTWYKA
jgi:hypothetical protein